MHRHLYRLRLLRRFRGGLLWLYLAVAGEKLEMDIFKRCTQNEQQMKLSSIVEFFEREQNSSDEVRCLSALLENGAHFTLNFNMFEIATAPNDSRIIHVQDIISDSGDEGALVFEREEFIFDVQWYLKKLSSSNKAQKGTDNE